MIQFRTFRNTDPPLLTRLWNETLTGRAAVWLRQTNLLEYFHFAKAYFDPRSLFVAETEGQLVGFAQAGFGPNESETTLDPHRGVLCLLGVHPEWRRKGIATQLLERAENYLRAQGATELYAGPMAPLNPYTFGLYGGSQSPGFLESDVGLGTFLERRGYVIVDTALVLQRPLDRPFQIVDARFPTLRRRFELKTVPSRGTTTWYQECVRGPIEVLEIRIEERNTGTYAGRALVWEMDTFSLRWNEHVIGLLHVDIREDLRRQGLGRLLLSQILRFYQDQYFTLVEAQVRQANQAAAELLLSLGFDQIDVGHLYQKKTPAPG